MCGPCLLCRILQDNILGNSLFLNLLLSDPSPIIGYACQSLPNSRLVSLIDVTLLSEDDYWKLEVVTIADVSDDDRVSNSLLQIWKLMFGHKA